MSDFENLRNEFFDIYEELGYEADLYDYIYKDLKSYSNEKQFLEYYCLDCLRQWVDEIKYTRSELISERTEVIYDYEPWGDTFVPVM